MQQTLDTGTSSNTKGDSTSIEKPLNLETLLMSKDILEVLSSVLGGQEIRDINFLSKGGTSVVCRMDVYNPENQELHTLILKLVANTDTNQNFSAALYSEYLILSLLNIDQRSVPQLIASSYNNESVPANFPYNFIIMSEIVGESINFTSDFLDNVEDYKIFSITRDSIYEVLQIISLGIYNLDFKLSSIMANVYKEEPDTYLIDFGVSYFNAGALEYAVKNISKIFPRNTTAIFSSSQESPIHKNKQLFNNRLFIATALDEQFPGIKAEYEGFLLERLLSLIAVTVLKLLFKTNLSIYFFTKGVNIPQNIEQLKQQLEDYLLKTVSISKSKKSLSDNILDFVNSEKFLELILKLLNPEYRSSKSLEKYLTQDECLKLLKELHQSFSF